VHRRTKEWYLVVHQRNSCAIVAAKRNDGHEEAELDPTDGSVVHFTCTETSMGTMYDIQRKHLSMVFDNQVFPIDRLLLFMQSVNTPEVFLSLQNVSGDATQACILEQTTKTTQVTYLVFSSVDDDEFGGDEPDRDHFADSHAEHGGGDGAPAGGTKQKTATDIHMQKLQEAQERGGVDVADLDTSV